MYLPKGFWPVQAHKKLKTLGATALISISLIGCGSEVSSTTEVVDTAVNAPTTISTLTSTVPPALFTVMPTSLPADTAVSLPTELPSATATALPTETPLPATLTPTNSGQYVDGEYLGDAVRTDRWGNTQVVAVIENGMLVNVEITQYPNSTNRSSQISWSAFPTLISEAIQSQNADSINIVTRATDTCVAFIESLDSALEDAAVGASS